jgi:hypothetical protein
MDDKYRYYRLDQAIAVLRNGWNAPQAVPIVSGNAKVIAKWPVSTSRPRGLTFTGPCQAYRVW